ncbi:pyridoxal phosphate-dependent aminotransferase [Kroppenstedtia eburnea]|uniref:Aminotransferase n=1 Tax=Kroppenstedtia eburnea TaxID=714067 RepID=A0A1N7IQZ6_9BACL|nr:pyridoxal phosphate-dependent aminotransferase [Kroppenstedtia eburnea]EGK13887.1 aspartate transaminase [Desmospora sp. 8437]QKI82105.1 pyridoxal phosphate-dependent aminotransferase [Kroppenstedtia eburnea]SIS39503.1 aspartate aminotransferase [Kroppenstedtia eburnea]
MKLSQRVQQLTPSKTIEITSMANELKKQGHDVIVLGAGEPDFNTPEHILDAAAEAMNQGLTKYTPAGGVVELKDAIRAKFQRDNRLDYKREEIVVTVGAKHALYNLFQVILDPGDEVIIPSPYWVSYIEQVKLAGGTPVIIEGKEETGFKVTPEQLKAAVTENTVAFLINSPSNPTGAMYTRQELQALGDICVEHDLTVISDEIYEHLIYGDEKHVSIASLSPELKARTVVINGVSKTYSMTGWRIGYAAGDARIIKAMSGLSSHSTSNPTSVAQYAALEALTGTQEPVERMLSAFKERRDYVVDRLQRIPGIRCDVPQGAFYVFANVEEAVQSGGYEDADAWGKALLEQEKVALVPGAAFGSSAHVRLSYATSMDQLQQAMDRIEKFVTRS